MRSCRSELFVTLALLALPTLAGAQLEPPPGPIATTNRTLKEIEPRTPLSSVPGSADAVHRITAPGRYYATANIDVPKGMSGVVIDIPREVRGGVSIDFGGFEIHGQPGSLNGVSRQGFYELNRLIEQSRVFIVGMGGDGIHIENAGGLTLSDVSIAGCGGAGVLASGCGDVSVSRATAKRCADGFDIEADRVELSNSTGADNARLGMKVKEKANRTKCSARLINTTGNGAGGFEFAEDDKPGDSDSEVTIEDATCADNQLYGLRVICRCSHLRGVAASNNKGDGMRLDSDCANLNDITCDDNAASGLRWRPYRGGAMVLHNASASRNGATAVVLDNSGVDASTCELRHVTCVDNAGDGLRLTKAIADGDAKISDSRFIRNGGDGANIDADSLELTDVTARGNTKDGVKHAIGHITLNHRVIASDNGECGIHAIGTGDRFHKYTSTECSLMSNGFAGKGGRPGMLIENAGSLALDGVESSGNSGPGISVTQFADLSLTGVRCSNNGGSGVYVASGGGIPGGRCVCRAGYFESNAGDGVRLESSTGGSIRDCTFSNNARAGLIVFGTGHVIERNTCIANAGEPIAATTPGNSVGPMIDEGGMAANCNPSANLLR